MSMFGMTDDIKAQLVHEIYKRPLIWKPSDPRYTDVPARWVAFEEVAQELSTLETAFSSDMIKMAWKNMTDYYNHIRRRNERARAAGLTPPPSKWNFYNMLHFIRQEKTPAKRKYNWLEPNKIHGDDAWLRELAMLPTNQEMDSTPDDELPRPIAIRPPMSAPEPERPPRTKQSEKAKLQARREALRESNLSTHSDSGILADYGTEGGSPRDLTSQALRMRVRDEMGRFVRGDDSDEDTTETRIFQSSVSKRGRKLIKRRLSISPSPPRTPIKTAAAPNNKKTNRASTAISPKDQKVKYDNPSPPSTSHTRAAPPPKPISALDSTSFFARGIAARLYMIKAESPAEYSNICEKINATLREAETALNLQPIDV